MAETIFERGLAPAIAVALALAATLPAAADTLPWQMAAGQNAPDTYGYDANSDYQPAPPYQAPTYQTIEPAQGGSYQDGQGVQGKRLPPVYPPSDNYSPYSNGTTSGDAYRPSTGSNYGDAYNPGYSAGDAYDPGTQPGYVSPAPDYTYTPPPANPPVDDGGFTIQEINAAGHRFFGSISGGLASVIEYAFKNQGRPNGYILGEEGGGAFVAGLRYGEGTLYTRDAGTHKVYWQGPSLGYDFGAEGSKTMILVYNLHGPSDIFQTFSGVGGQAYLVGGVGITYLSNGRVTLAPIRSGIGLRLGANVGYLKYTPNPTWNPF